MSKAIALWLMVPMSVVMERFRFSRPFVVAAIRGAVTFLETITLLGVLSIVMVESFSFCISLCFSFCRPLAITIIAAIGQPIASSIALGMMTMMTIPCISICICFCISFSISRPFAITIVSAIGQAITSPIALGMMSVMEGLRIGLGRPLVVLCCIHFRFSRPLVVSIVAAIRHPVVDPKALVMIAMVMEGSDGVMEGISFSVCIRRSF